MHIALDIPDTIVGVVAPGQDPARAALEAMALERVQQQSALTTPMQVHGFLKEHGVHLHYSMADLEHDIRESDRLIALRAAEAASEQRAG